MLPLPPILSQFQSQNQEKPVVFCKHMVRFQLFTFKWFPTIGNCSFISHQ